MLKEGSGIIAFIAQNNWTTSDGASKMRDKVVRDSQILKLIDFRDFKIFEASGIQTMIMLFKRDASLKKYTFDQRKLCGGDPVFEDVLSLLNKKKSSATEYLEPSIVREKFLGGKNLTFAKFEIESILDKLLSKSKFRFIDSEVGKGIEYNMDCVKKKHIIILGNKYKIGKGIFILGNTEKEQLSLAKKELSLIKPYYTTKELFRYYGIPENKKWIIYTDSSFKTEEKIRNYPNIKKHLDQFKQIITSDNKPYGLHRTRKESFFRGRKNYISSKV